MGTYHADGYSAHVEGHLIVRGKRYRVAKTNDRTFVLADPCELEPGAEGEIVVTIDGEAFSRLIVLPGGVTSSEPFVPYRVAAPF